MSAQYLQLIDVKQIAFGLMSYVIATIPVYRELDRLYGHGFVLLKNHILGRNNRPVFPDFQCLLN